MSSIGLYIHVPFCASKCAYCDFYSVTVSNHAAYLQALEQEAALHQGAVLDTVFIGGGTPSLLSSTEISTVLAMVSRYFHLQPAAEITLEANPGTVDRDYLHQCRSSGINRLSFGVQSFEPRLLRLLGRRHTAAEAEQAVITAADLGFPHVSLDLIYGIPGQSLADWERTLQAACRLPIDHLSLYSLEVHAETPLGRAVDRGEMLPPDDDLMADMYQLARDLLPEQGLCQYEISNFARLGAACRHNVNYWQNGDYLGLGPAACSYLGGERRCNQADLGEWVTRLVAGSPPPAEGERLNERASMAETVVLGLRLVTGVDGQAFRQRYGQTLEQVFGPTISQLLSAGLLRRTERGYALPGELLSVANQVMLAFLE